VAVASGLAMLGWTMIPPTRAGTGLVAALAVAAIAAVAALSRRGDWGQPHVLALAGGALGAAGASAFLTTPIGDVDTAEKYGHNVTLLLIVLVLSALAAHRVGRGGPERRHVPA
ncbi:hypothetical protein, partial [Nocardioides sp.]|uniref:hypothetical protein n=1 Tax=Nocardioides sp. TaxID=35761 RepID=UPI002ED9F91A